MTFCSDPALAADRSRIASKPAPKPSRLPKPPDATGPSCTADYFTGAPRVENCNASGDGWGGRPPCGDHCGRLNVACETTANDYELPRGHRFRDVK